MRVALVVGLRNAFVHRDDVLQFRKDPALDRQPDLSCRSARQLWYFCEVLVTIINKFAIAKAGSKMTGEKRIKIVGHDQATLGSFTIFITLISFEFRYQQKEEEPDVVFGIEQCTFVEEEPHAMRGVRPLD